jgi:hypothetical protein
MAAAEVLAFRASWTESAAYGFPTTRPLTRTTGWDEAWEQERMREQEELVNRVELKLRLHIIAQEWVERCRRAKVSSCVGFSHHMVLSS